MQDRSDAGQDRSDARQEECGQIQVRTGYFSLQSKSETYIFAYNRV